MYDTASRLPFLGSEESILDIESDRSSAAAAAARDGAAAATAAAAPNDTQRRLPPTNRVSPAALVDLIRSRDFVIDFPRIFVLDAGGTTGTRDANFPTRMPERSQSTLSLAHAKDWMTMVTNKLEEQQGLRRVRKANQRPEMQENLLNVSVTDSIKRRRSRSADGRYSSGFFGRKELTRQLTEEAVPSGETGSNSCRRNSVTLRGLTDASYAMSKQRQREDLGLMHARRRSGARRCSDVLVTERYRENSPPTEVGITIQINGEGVVDLN